MDVDDSCDVYGGELDFGEKTEGEEDNPVIVKEEEETHSDEKMEHEDLNSKFQEQAARIKALEAELGRARESGGRWESVCLKVAECLGVDFDPTDPVKLVRSLQDFEVDQKKQKVEDQQHRTKVANLQFQLYQKRIEIMSLKESLHKARLASDPAVIQLKQLLLDPALQKEFRFLKSELEEKKKEVKKLQEELDGVTFTQDSKAGKMLVAKCKKLQEENEDMGRELSEGRVHHLETQLALAKNFAEEMRKKCLDMEEHCSALDEEAEDLQQQIFMLKGEPNLHQNPDISNGGGVGGVVGGSGGGLPPSHINAPHQGPHRSPRDVHASPGGYAGERFDGRKGRARSGDRKRGLPPPGERMAERMSPGERGVVMQDRPPPVRGPIQPFARRRIR
ncbi:hypothetical protein BSKO_10383 [Bryopsis sp. KO-2023]|nr:hypothetical protein BSKO_10383 [Bryopsis sp. KO-2023]